MVKTCYLHFGMPKTGTTSIQHSLHRFENDKIVYAKFAETHHSTGLQLLFSEDGMRFNQTAHDRKLAKIGVDSLRKRYKRRLDASVSGDRDMILSSELISDRLTFAELTKLRDYLRQHFDEIRAIAYVRPFQSSAPSNFQQRIKSGSDVFSVGTAGYRKRIEPFFTLFGRENVELVPFIRNQLKGGDVVVDFLTRVGIDPAAVVPVTKNEARSLEAIAQIYMQNCFAPIGLEGPLQNRRRLALSLDLAGFGTRKVGFSKELMDEAVDRCADDIAWISKEIGQDMTGSYVEVEEPLRDVQHLMSIAHVCRGAALDHLNGLRSAGKSRLAEVNKQEAAGKNPIRVVKAQRGRVMRRIRKFFGVR